MNLQTFASEADGGAAGRKTVQADSFLTLHYSLSLENGTEVVSTFEDKPATLLLGQGQFAPTLEQALLGMPEGERMTYRLAPEQAFGPRNPELLQWVSLATLRAQGDKVIFVSSSHANYSPMQASNPSVTTSALWGDANAGAHGTFSKFVPGYDAGMHTHTNDVWIVVVKGAYLYKDDAGEKRVGVGDFLRVPGGHKHWSGGDKKEGAIFYEESSGKFDFIPAK